MDKGEILALVALKKSGAVDVSAAVAAKVAAQAAQAAAEDAADDAVAALAQEYSTSATYSVGDYCVKDGTLYRCTTAISTAESWTAAHWTAVKVTTEIASGLGSLKSQISNTVIENYVLADGIVLPLPDYFTGHGFVTVDTTHNTYSIGSSSSYNYYTVPTTGLQKIKVHGFSGTSIKAVVFANDSNDLISYYPTEGIPAPGQNVDIECEVPSGATKLFITSNSAPASLVDDRMVYQMNDTMRTAMKNVDQIDDIEIDGYSRSYDSASGTLEQNYVAQVSSNAIKKTSLSNWQNLEVDCSQYSRIKVSGYSGSSVSLYIFVDIGGTVISTYPYPSSNTAYSNIVVDVPANAVKVYVNGHKTNNPAVALYQGFHFTKGDSTDVGVEIAENSWDIGTGKFITNAELFGSRNGTFCYKSLKYDAADFKGVTDDVTPVQLDYGYVGANHGWNQVFIATLANHGLTEADIGKTCEVDGITWMLLQVNSTSVFTVGALNAALWLGLDIPQTVSTTFDFGTQITVTSIERTQLYPSVKNVKVNVVANTEKEFVVSESYDIINPKNALTAMMDNVGDNDNNSVVDLSDDVALTVRNLYNFGNDGSCVITQNLKVVDISRQIHHYGATQSGAFGGTDYFAVPMTSYDLLSASGTQIDFLRTEWDDQSKPPIIYVQADNTSANSTKMFVQGVLVENRNDLLGTSAGFIYTSRKMYPYAISGQTADESGDTYSITSFRIPAYSNDLDDSVKFVGYCKVGSSYYFYAYNPTSVEKCISVPHEMLGKNISVVIAKNAKCLNETTSTGIDLKITGEGYVLLKLE